MTIIQGKQTSNAARSYRLSYYQLGNYMKLLSSIEFCTVVLHHKQSTAEQGQKVIKVASSCRFQADIRVFFVDPRIGDIPIYAISSVCKMMIFCNFSNNTNFTKRLKSLSFGVFFFCHSEHVLQNSSQNQ